MNTGKGWEVELERKKKKKSEGPRRATVRKLVIVTQARIPVQGIMEAETVARVFL